jgi:signal peptidase
MIPDLTDRFGGTLGALLIALAVLPFVLFAVPQLAGASHSYVVLSDSMSPQIHAGDVVFVDDVDAAAIEEGDVVTFDRPGGDDRVTHRVVDVRESGGELLFQTKGDANEEADAQLVPAENVVGRVAFHVPYLGHVVTLVGSDVGLFSFVVVPTALLVVNELWAFYRAATGESEQVATDGGQ